MDHGHHGGDIYRNEIIYDFSVNTNPLGMPKEVYRALAEGMGDWERYPDPECGRLTERLAACYRIPVSWIICGSGAADLIYQLALFRRPGKALVTAPAFSEYEHALQAAGCQVIYEKLRQEEQFALRPQRMAEQIDGDTKLVFVCNPNNPTGMMVDAKELLTLADACRKQQALLVIDECFCELSDRPETGSFLPFLERYPEVLVLRAFTKTYAMAGLRLGYGISSSRELIEGLLRMRQPWSVSVPAQQAGVAALGRQDYLQNARAMIRKERERLKNGLEELGFLVYPSEANYLLFQDRREESCGNLWEQLKAQKILIRDCSSYRGLGEGFYRIGVRTPKENEILLEKLKMIVSGIASGECDRIKHEKKGDGYEFIQDYSCG